MALREVFARFRTQFDGSALQRGAAQVGGLTSGLNAGLGALTRLGSAFLGLEIVSIVRSWISAVVDFVGGLTDLGDELSDSAARLGLSVTTLQAWRHAAGQGGVGADALSGALARLQRAAAGAAEGGEAQAAVFRRLGVSARDAEGNARPLESLLPDLADGFARMENTTERGGAAMELFGRSGTVLLPFLSEGREGLAAMTAELERLGGGASVEMIESAARLDDALNRLDLSILSIKSRIAVALLPIVENLTEAVTTVTAWFARHEAASLALEVAVVTLATVIGILAVVLLIILSPVILLIVVLFGTLFVIVGTVVLVIQDLYTWITGGESLIGGFVESMLAAAGISWDPIRREITSTIETMRRAYNSIAGVLGLPTIDADTAPDTSTAGPKREGTRGAQESTGLDARDRGEAQFGQVLVRGLRQGSERFRRERDIVPFVRGSARPAQTVQQTNNLTFQGMADPRDFEAIARRVLDRSNRDAVEALGQ